MVKRKITVTVDEDLVANVQQLGTESLSSVVNAALAAEVARRSRAVALERLLNDWDAVLGPVSAAAADAAREAFDDLDAVGPISAADPGPGRSASRRGAA